MIGKGSYLGGTKATWRGWAWNRIIEHFPGYHSRMTPRQIKELCSDKVGLYLPGPCDFDRMLAMKKGFQNKNLIAVDIQKERVERIRAVGGVALHASIQEVLAARNFDIPLDFVFSDMCHNVNLDVLYFAANLHASPAIKAGTVVAVNLLRGRESYGFELVKESISYHDRITSMMSRYIEDLGDIPDRLHRGFFFVTWYLGELSGGLDCCSLLGAELSVRRSAEAAPVYYSYKSEKSNSYFDTVIFKIPADWHNAARAQNLKPQARKRVRNISGRIAALKAMRTSGRFGEYAI